MNDDQRGRLNMITNIAAYQFAALSDLKALRTRLLAQCLEGRLKGTILLSTEGINLFVAGARPEIDHLVAELRALPGLESLNPKYSESADQPFNRMLVRIKKEIIAFGQPGIHPEIKTSRKISAQTLKQWLDQGRKVTLLDTRNDYEVKLGTFKGAKELAITHFKEFPDAVRKLPVEMKSQPIVMFCTGGIRCEKAGPFMEQQGFNDIFQLDGGILKYFEECGGAHYQGECFVFDQRVGVDPALRETDSIQCYACQTPLTPEEQADERYVPSRTCPYCFKTSQEKMAENISYRHEKLRQLTTPLPGSVPYDNRKPLTVPLEHEGSTFVEFVGGILKHVSSEKWESTCERGEWIDANDRPVDATHRVRAGERYYHLQQGIIEPEVSVALRILHEDEAIFVLDKPAPLPVHPSGRFNRNTLLSILHDAYYPQKPRAAHRLDANTTGLMVWTRTRHFAGILQPQFARGEVEKVYQVKVQGHPEWDNFICDAPITEEPDQAGARQIDRESGIPARTEFKILERYSDGTTLIEANLFTGRTNQIRVHLWSLGFPVCGDLLYLPDHKMGTKQTLEISDPPLWLHAWKLAFIHPLTKKKMTFETPGLQARMAGTSF